MPLPQSRRLITDLLHFAKKVPSQPLVRHSDIGPLARLQRDRDGGPRVSWSTLFMKAYGILSARHAPLRQCYMSWPWPHLYEHPFPVGRITVSRSYRGQDWVFFGHVPHPERHSLPELQELLETFKHAPVKSVNRFWRQLVVSRFPTPLRRLAWWLTIHGPGGLRMDRVGTFGMTSVSGRGAISVHPPSLPTTTLTYGPVDETGRVRITIVYDHRVMDGGTVGAYLEELESLLNGEILGELRTLHRSMRSAPANPPKSPHSAVAVPRDSSDSCEAFAG